MGSVAHVIDDKKELVKEVHRLARLGVKPEESSKVSFVVCQNSELSLVVDLKSKKH